MLSVVTWDASFRESFHSIDSFGSQSIAPASFEFIWTEYYSQPNAAVADAIEKIPNGRVFCYGGTGAWHLGRCLNAAVGLSAGDLIVIPDGDVIVEHDFLAEVISCHSKFRDMVLYFRRWDEPECPSHDKCTDLNSLRRRCVLANPTNYGGCLTLPRKLFLHVRGYNESSLFSEAGANGLELYTRLKNAGFPIMWHPTMKIFHPWHNGTSPSSSSYMNRLNSQLAYIRQLDLDVGYLPHL